MTISVEQLAERQASGEQFQLIDVREHDEWEICHLAGAHLLPLSEVHRWAEELAQSTGLMVIYCHHGIRSARVCAMLRQMGHKQVLNLTGGIDRWAVAVAPATPRY